MRVAHPAARSDIPSAAPPLPRSGTGHAQPAPARTAEPATHPAHAPAAPRPRPDAAAGNAVRDPDPIPDPQSAAVGTATTAPIPRRRARIALAVLTLFTLLVSANLATPLFPRLEPLFGAGALGTSLAFSSYVLALIAGLLVFRRFADTANRRTLFLASVSAAALATGTLALAPLLSPALGWFSAARALQGIAIACATGAGSAALRALLPDRPDLVGRLTLLSTSGGVAAGPVIGGALSLIGPPLATPFVVVAAALAILIPLLLTIVPHRACAPHRPALPTIDAPHARAGRRAREPRGPLAPEALRAFRIAAATGFLSFAVFGFLLSLAPTHFAAIAGTASPLAIGALAAVTLASSAAVQLLPLPGGERAGAIAGRIGLIVLAIALLGIAAAGRVDAVWFLVLACALAGAGQGVAFRSAFTALIAAVPADRTASTVSAVYTVTYLGSAAPVLGLGALAAGIGLGAAVVGYAAALAAGALVLAIATGRREGRAA